MADFLTLANLQAEVERAIKHYKASQASMVKAMINMVYLNELMVCDDLYPLYWMIGFDDSLKSVAPATITAISKANPGVVTTDDVHGVVVGDLITHHNIVGMTELNDRIQQVAAVGDTTHYSFGENTSGYTAWSSGGTMHHRGKTFTTSVQHLLAAGWCGQAKMVEITYQEIEKNTSYQYNDTTCRPQRWYHGKGYGATGTEVNQIIWHPGADAAYILRYWYEARAARLTAAGNVPLLPPQFHDAIIAGAITRLAESNVQVENAVVWPSIYKNQILAFQTFNRKFFKENDVAFREKPYLL